MTTPSLLHLTVLNEVAGEGAVNTALVLEYSATLSAVAPDAFAVQGRTVTAAYSSASDVPGTPGNGPYVIIELEPQSILERVRGRNEHINIHALSLAVQQLGNLTAIDGTVLYPDGVTRIATKNRTLIADSFHQFTRGSLTYNLYVPDDYDPAASYPLVLFIADAGSNGADPRIALYQGLGATGFAAPESQAKQPCFVLVPMIPSRVRLTNDDFEVTPELEEIMDTLRYVTRTYSIDPRRITTTGQSQGCMASCELLIRYPEFFAGALLVAGQWSPERMAEKALHNSMWIIVSAGDRGAFPGMNAVTEAMERAGAEIHRYQWNGQAGKAALEAQAQAMAADEGTIKYAVFDADSVKTAANSGPGANHGGTWALVYTIDAVRQWLLSRENPNL